MSETFRRTKEDFVCEHCGTAVTGNGYTNHCPNCLWSKHVDVHPGDRAAECGGMMEPVSVSSKSGEYIITHKCTRCGYEKNNSASAEDSIDVLAEIARNTLP
jgi:ribosomal protein L37AE/L43A